MITELENAIDAEEDIVVTLWTPFWAMPAYDMKALEDPEGAFGEPEAKGFVQHRIAFFPKDAPPRHGKLQLQDYGAEAMSLKRVLERKAGNLDSFARGMSYQPGTAT